MVLVIDNYDSFTYNLVQYLGEMGVDLQVHRNDQITLEQARALNPERILVSPGPCSPNESGLSNDIIREFGQRIPVFGVCLGHQCIGHTFGAKAEKREHRKVRRALGRLDGSRFSPGRALNGGIHGEQAGRFIRTARPGGNGKPAYGSRLTLFQLEEILHDRPAAFGQDALGMELHAPDWERLVAEAHDFALVGFGGDFEAIGEGVAFDDERVVAGRGEGIGHAHEQILAVMLNERGFAVHHAVVHDDVAAEDMADALVPETDAEGWGVRAESADDVIRQA